MWIWHSGSPQWVKYCILKGNGTGMAQILADCGDYEWWEIRSDDVSDWRTIRVVTEDSVKEFVKSIWYVPIQLHAD